MNLRKAAIGSFIAAAVLCGCGPAMERITVRMSGNVPDATVTLDDIFLGSLSYVHKHGVAVPPGKHRITVERVGYFPWDKIVEATEQPIVLDVKLEPIPD